MKWEGGKEEKGEWKETKGKMKGNEMRGREGNEKKWNERKEKKGKGRKSSSVTLLKLHLSKSKVVLQVTLLNYNHELLV